LHLYNDVLAFPTQLQVYAAVEPATGTAGADVIDIVPLRPVVVGQQVFQAVPLHLGQGIVATMRYMLQSVAHDSPYLAPTGRGSLAKVVTVNGRNADSPRGYTDF